MKSGLCKLGNVANLTTLEDIKTKTKRQKLLEWRVIYFMESLRIMATKNDVTGDMLISRVPSEAYKNNYDAIFRKGNPEQEKQNEQQKQEQSKETIV